ncbi:MAG: hypothetical protein SGILL_004058 [Bacillariaceae sp.]
MGAKGKQNAKRRAAEAPERYLSTPEPAAIKTGKQFTSLGKLVVFLVFPVFVGILGLLATYLDKSDPDRKLRIERDFALPFSITLLLTVVIGFQTNGYTTKPKPLVRWPKVKKQQKVRHVHVVKGQDPNVDDHGENEHEDKKND